MSATKLERIIGLLLKAEASYGAGGSVAAADDGFLLAGKPELEHFYPHTGERRMAPGTGANQRRVPPTAGSGLHFPILHEAKGAGAAYDDSPVVVPSVHRALLGACFSAAFTDPGGASARVDYTPTPGGLGSGFTSLLGSLYTRQHIYPVTGLYTVLESIECPDGGVPLWTFRAKGIRGTIADAVVPAITYPALSIEGPKGAGLALTFGSFTTNAIVREWKLLTNWGESQPRLNQNAAGGFAGYTRSIVRNPVLEVLFEATALVGSPFHTSAGLDPYKLYEAATEIDCAVNVGSVQFNRWDIIPGKIQLAGPPAEEEGPGGEALWRISAQCNPTTVNGNDDLTIRFR